MRTTQLLLVSTLLLVSFALPASAAPKAAAKPVAKSTTGVSEAAVQAAVNEFVEALNSLDEERVLKSLSPSDRLALRGRDNLLGVVYGRKILNPTVKSFEKVEQGGKAVGAKAMVSLQEVDPIDSTQIPKERTWFLALDGNQLRVSLLSVWLDAGKVQEAAQEGSGE